VIDYLINWKVYNDDNSKKQKNIINSYN